MLGWVRGCFPKFNLSLLNPHTRYSITIEEIRTADPPDVKVIKQWVRIGELSPYEEVEITRDTEMEDSAICALSLCLA